MIIQDIATDNYLRYEHSEVINSSANDLDAVGATSSLTKRILSGTPDDTNTIFVQTTGSNDTGDGTLANPYRTIEYAQTKITASKKSIGINDSGTYAESQINMSGDFTGLFATMGNTPTITPAEDPLRLDLVSTLTDYEMNQTSVFSESDEYNRYGVQLELSNGNHAVVYAKQLKTVTNENSAHDHEWRCRIYNSSFTVQLYDTLLFTQNGTNHGFPANNGHYPYIQLEDGFVAFVGCYAGWYRVVVSNAGSMIGNMILPDSDYHRPLGHGYITGNKWYYIGYSSSYHCIFTVYENNTQVYTVTVSNTTMSYLTCDGTYAHFCSNNGSTNIGTFYKLNLSTYTTTTTTVDGTSIGWYAYWWRMGIGYYYIFHYESKYYCVAFSAVPQKWFIAEFDLSTYTLVGGNTLYMLIDDALAARTWPLVHTAPSSIDTLKPIGGPLFLFTFWYPYSGSYYIVYNVLDVTKFDRTTMSEIDCYPCITGQTAIPNTDMNFTYYAANYYFISDDLQIITRIPGRILRIFDTYIVKATVPAMINGITFDALEKPYIRGIIKATAAADIKYCTLGNIYNTATAAGNKFDSYLMTGTGAATVKNNYGAESSLGFKLTNSSVSFERNIVMRCTDGNAVEITGSGTGVVFKYNTLFSNYSGLELKSNAGTETVKDSIFYQNTGFGVKSAVAVTVTNSCCTDTLVTAVLDSNTSNTLNPLFFNEGTENPEQTDLHLKSRTAGYSLNSPALRISDDGLDAGCYNVEYIVLPATYTAFEMPKPKKITVIISPVNPVEVTSQDGTYTSTVDAWQLEVELDYDSIRSRYITHLLKMYTATGDIRIYFSPASDPYKFETMKLKYKDLPLTNDFYGFNSVGQKDIKLTFVRKFDPSELT